MRRGNSSGGDAQIALRFFAPSLALRPYITTLYRTEVCAAPGVRIIDYLHPEWANIRFIEGEMPLASIGDDPPRPAPAFNIIGPTSKARYFSAGSLRSWGIGLLPLGWAKFVPAPAAAYADLSCDGSADTAFAMLAPLQARLQHPDYADPDVAAQMIDDHLVSLLAAAPPDDPAILAVHRALVDDDHASVDDLARALGMSERSVERLSLRAFGFPPKLLLRRQRFLRSLARFMLDPSMAWINAIDVHYHDQAQFTRDFTRFMGMGPRDYAARPKPILGAAAIARAAATGDAMQGLHKPQSQPGETKRRA